MEECTVEMKALRRRGIGSVLNYSAEAEVDEGSGGSVEEQEKVLRMLQERRLRQVELALDEAGEFEEQIAREGGIKGSTAFALKIVCRRCHFRLALT